MSWSDQQRLADVLLVEQITAVRADGGEALVRERVASLSESGRQLLHDALEAAAA
jgi:hypothetical protein